MCCVCSFNFGFGDIDLDDLGLVDLGLDLGHRCLDLNV